MLRLAKPNSNFKCNDLNTQAKQVKISHTCHLMHWVPTLPPCSLVPRAHVQEPVYWWFYQFQEVPINHNQQKCWWRKAPAYLENANIYLEKNVIRKQVCSEGAGIITHIQITLNVIYIIIIPVLLLVAIPPYSYIFVCYYTATCLIVCL